MTDDLLIAVHPDSVAYADQAAEQAREISGRAVRVQVSPLVPAGQLLVIDAAALNSFGQALAAACQCPKCRAARSYDAHCDGCADLGYACADHEEPRC